MYSGSKGPGDIVRGEELRWSVRLGDKRHVFRGKGGSFCTW